MTDKPICSHCHAALPYDGAIACPTCGKAQHYVATGEASHARRFATQQSAETTHTPERWYISNASGTIKRIAAGNGVLVAECNSGVHGATEKNAANAARIVACVNACANLSDPAADVAALREALQDLAAMADGQRQTFNEFWETVETLRPGRDLGGDAAVIRGGYLSIADKARAVLARTERRSA